MANISCPKCGRGDRVTTYDGVWQEGEPLKRCGACKHKWF